MSAEEMTCSELVEAVTDYLEGALPEQDVVRLEGHLRDCSGCLAYIEQIRETIKLFGFLPSEELSRSELAPLLEVFRRWKNDNA